MIHALFPSLFAIFSAFVLDAIIGDPETKYHPIRFIGWLIKKGEASLYDMSSPKRLSGIVLVLGTIVVTLCTTVGIFFALFYFAPWLAWWWTVIVIYFCLAFRSLIDAGERVCRDLLRRDLAAARMHLSWIVSRDTAALQESDIVRGAIESLSENLNDAIIAPLFYAFLFGMPGIVLYKTANTLDSMIGYKSERYIKFGWCAARLDDILNYIPARVAFLFVFAAAAILRYHPISAWKTVARYSQTGESPNGGIGICASAGALGITLGGTNTFHGAPSPTPIIPPVGIAMPAPLSLHQIRRAEYLIVASTLIGVTFFALISWGLR
jgi:adenosylcobinamide-phosphate synthase